MAKDHSTETFGSWSKGLLCSPRIDRDTGAKVKTERHPDFLFLLHIIKERSQDADKHGHYSAGVEKKRGRYSRIWFCCRQRQFWLIADRETSFYPYSNLQTGDKKEAACSMKFHGNYYAKLAPKHHT